MLVKWSLCKVGQMNFENHGHDSAHFLRNFHSNSVSTTKFMSTCQASIVANGLPSANQSFLSQDWAVRSQSRSVTIRSATGPRPHVVQLIVRGSQSLPVLASGSSSPLHLTWKLSIRGVLPVLRHAQALTWEIKDTSGWQAQINHLTLSSSDVHPEAEFSKLKMIEYFTDLIIFSVWSQQVNKWVHTTSCVVSWKHRYML